MIKKFFQTLIPFLTLKILIFTLKFSSKTLQNLENKIESSEKLNGKNILLDSLIELLLTLKQSISHNKEKQINTTSISKKQYQEINHTK